MNTPAHEDSESSNEPGPGFSPGPGFMPPPASSVRPPIEQPSLSPSLAAAPPGPGSKRVKRWKLAGNGTRGIAIFLALCAFAALREPGNPLTDAIAAGIFAAPLIYLLTSSKPVG